MTFAGLPARTAVQRAKIGRLMMICLLATVSCELDKVCTVQGSILRCIRMSREMKCEDVGEKLSSADWPVLLASKTEMSIFIKTCLYILKGSRNIYAF